MVTDHCIEAYEYDGYMCQNCEKGYAINRNKHICVEFPKCKRVDDDNKCIECDEDKNEFLSADLEGKCIVSPCEKFEEDGTCNECKDYFYLKDGECVYISHIPFCRGVEDDNINECEHWVSFTSNPETAEQDKKNYEEKCLTRKEDGTCSECETGYLYDETEKKCLLIGCEEYEESPRCEYCEHGYILINDKVQKIQEVLVVQKIQEVLVVQKVQEVLVTQKVQAPLVAQKIQEVLEVQKVQVPLVAQKIQVAPVKRILRINQEKQVALVIQEDRLTLFKI